MPPEAPNKRMDDLLRRYSEKRRQQAGVGSPHPATRRMLQAEVSRLFGAGTSSAPTWSLWTWLMAWRAPAVACGVLLILVTGVWFFWNSERKPAATFSLAKNNSVAAPVPPPVTAPMKPAEFAAGSGHAARVEKEVPPSASPVTAVNAPAAGVPAEPVMLSQAAPRPLDVAERAEAGANVTPSLARAAPSPTVANGSFDSSDVASLAMKQKVENVQDKVAGAMRTNGTLASNYKLAAGKGGRMEDFAAINSGSQVANQTRESAIATQNAAQQQVAATSPSQTAAPGGQSYFFNNAPQNAQQLAVANDPARSAGTQSQLQRMQPGQAQQNEAVQNRADAMSPVSAQQFSGGAAQQMDAVNAGDEFVRDPSPPAPEKALDAVVLTRFRIQQSGNRVQIVDADSSVYDVEFTDPLGRARDANGPLKDREEARGSLSPAAAPVRFKASGTNRTLGKAVVLNGQLTPSTTNVPVDESRARRGLAAQIVPPASSIPTTTPLRPSQAAGPQTDQVVATNATALEGTLRVGTAPEHVFRATRVRP